MNRRKVYLAGCVEVEDTWRGEAEKLLHDLGFETINPIRQETIRIQNGVAVSSLNPKAVMDRNLLDLHDMRRSGGFILMNLNSTREGRRPMGCLMELMWAYERQVPVIAFMGDDTHPDIRYHPWIRSCITCCSESLEGAIGIIRRYFQ